MFCEVRVGFSKLEWNVIRIVKKIFFKVNNKLFLILNLTKF